MPETRTETTRESRREGEHGGAPNPNDVTPSAPDHVSSKKGGTPAQPDPSSGGDLRHDGRQKGGSTGSSG